MTCDDYRRQLQARLDGEPVGDEDFDAHLAACPECRSLEGAARRLRVGLLSMTAPAPPAGLSDRIVVGVLADRRKRRTRRRLVFAATGFAVAASLVVAVLVSDGRPPQGGAGDQPGPAPQARNDSTREQPAPPPSLNDHVAEATSAVASLARRTADQTVSDGQVLVPSVPVEVPPEELLGPPLEPPAQSLREAGHGVATGLEPVASSARQALDLFLRDIPPVAPENRSGL